jgi:hypothetical protein
VFVRTPKHPLRRRTCSEGAVTGVGHCGAGVGRYERGHPAVHRGGGAATPLSAIRFPRVRLCHDLMTLAQRHGQEVARDLWHYRGSAPGC